MPAPHTSKQFSVGVYDKKHLRNLSSRLRKVLALLDDAAVKAVKIGRRTGFRDEEKDFRFDDFPQARREIDALLGELASGLSVNVLEGISEAWGTSNAKNDAMVDSMLGAAGAGLPKKATRRWYNHNERAMNAFIRRREAGMGLSENVWNLAQFKEELELALESGLVQGVSAAEMSRDVRSCLRNPDKLFRRVRDEKGVLRLSRAAQAYHPGRGVYRSSYKNALRLTATETNMAYRTADNKRWGQIDFVLGQHIEPSHTNHPVVDICDELKGDYPKDFKFVGWHPFCRCFAVPKMASPEKFLEYQQAILDGKDVSDWKWDGEVKDVPEGFKGWVKENEERIANAKSLPYFLKDNPKYVGVKQTAQAEPVKDIHDQMNTMSPELRARIDLRNERNREYRRLLDNPNYENVTFNDETLGLKANHIGHNFDKKGGEYEKHVRDAGYHAGHAVILENELGGAFSERFTEGTWNGKKFEVAGCETGTSNNILHGLSHCASKRETKIAVIDFPKGGFNQDVWERTLGRYRGLKGLETGQYFEFERIICVQEGEIIVDIPFP